MQVNLILTVAPYTPDKRGDRSVVRDGVREDVTGSSILLPDLMSKTSPGMGQAVCSRSLLR